MNLRKASAVLALVCLSLASVHAQTSTLTGHIEGIGDQPILFLYDVDGKQQRDTVYATNDRFTYQPRLSDDSTISLYIRSPRFTSFWYEPGQITVTGNAKTPYKLIFKGTPENEILDKYQQEIGWVYSGKKEEKATREFIQEHPESRTAANLLYRITSSAEKEDEIYQKLWNILSPAMQTSYFGQKVNKRIEILKNQPIIGRNAPNFTIPDTAGVAVSLSDFKGKYVLLDFWGHWCAPCIKSFPKVKALQSEYGDKLAIIGIALEFESDKEIWLKAIRKYEANWTQLSHLKFRDSPTDMQYSITEYLTYLLLDKEGMVLERSGVISDIEKKLKELDSLKE